MHRRQHIAKVRLVERAVERVCDGGARSDTDGVREPASIVLVRSERRPHLDEDLVAPLPDAPPFPDTGQILPRRLGVGAKGGALCSRMEEHERPRPLRIGRGEQDGHRAPLVRAEDHWIGRPRRVENRVQVLHPRLQRRELAAVIGETGSPLVEQDQPERTGEAEVEVAPPWILPPVHEVRGPLGHVHEVDVAFAHHLVGDRDSTVARVPDLWEGRTI